MVVLCHGYSVPTFNILHNSPTPPILNYQATQLINQKDRPFLVWQALSTSSPREQPYPSPFDPSLLLERVIHHE